MMTDTIGTSKVLHRTTTWTVEGDKREYHFVSIDGGNMWLEIDHAPTQEDRKRIQMLIDGTRDSETKVLTRPMMVTRRYFGMMATPFAVSDIREAVDS